MSPKETLMDDPDTLARQIAPHLAAIVAIVRGRPAESPDDLLPEAEACRIAACSRRTLADARKRREIPSYGRQRDRAYRRGDLQAWIESRRVVHPAMDDDDIARRVRRLSKGAPK
jgi:hypothetical protein